MLLIEIAVTWLFHGVYYRTGKVSQQPYDNILEHALLAEINNSKPAKNAEQFHSADSENVSGAIREKFGGAIADE